MESFPTVTDQVTAMGSVTPVRSSVKRANTPAMETRGLERARPIETAREVEAPAVREQILPAPRSDTLNRAVNLAISVIGLIVLSPLLVLIAAIQEFPVTRELAMPTRAAAPKNVDYSR